ncbi:cell division protein FtsZ [Fulvimarina sp. 2208YS6-2-32]|uniref:Cell division protein FtsZ n=1 Tax=Fulvimarina uroteuthidis TaxID=3098149 RepID=A0ABU5HXW7_9HYPH|nr:cell division protein FtsZ [Fulvimarina sp. 2208YS6-2-32]MDY8107900.1 cell division protein FtsZ [Fulvimarina sp. 2208YS6-2-32]
MSITLNKPDITELKPRITVFGVGGGGCNAVNNMISAGLEGVEFVIANTDAQALRSSKAERVIQMGVAVTEGLGAGSQPEVGRAAAEESIDEICDHLLGSHMCFVTAGMGGGTGTGAAPVVARAAREKGILTVGVVTKPFHFEGQRRLRIADQGIEDLQKNVDTLIVIPNQNLFRIANDKTTFADAFGMADQVLYSGVACITDLMVKEGLINLDFADVRSVMREMGKAMMGTGEASGEGRALAAAEAAIANPLLDETSMKGARGLLISITGGRDLTLFEVDEAATRIREEVDSDANIILGATFDEALEGIIRVSVVATGIDKLDTEKVAPKSEPAQRPAAAAPSVPAKAPAAHAPVAETRRQEAAHAPAQPARQSVPASQPQMRNDPLDMDDDFSAALAAEIEQLAPRVSKPVIHAAPSRMPKIEDFPPVVKNEIETRAAQAEYAGDDKGPMGLLRRLTTGLSRREEVEEVVASEPRKAEAPMPAPQAAPRRQAAESAARPAPQPRALAEDDHLEIPAFLRRQAN